MAEATIHQRVIAILADLPAIGKTQKNVQQGFMFRGQDDVMNALNPLLAKHGVFVVPDVLERVSEHRTTSKGSVMFEVNLHVRFTFYGAAGDSVSGSAWGEGTDMGDKSTNKAMTAAFKYALNQVFAISTAEAPDSDRDTPEESVARKAPQNSEEETKTPDAPGAAAKDAATAQLMVRLLAVAAEWKTLVPDFGTDVGEKIREHQSDKPAELKAWLERQIATFENNIAVKRADVAKVEAAGAAGFVEPKHPTKAAA